MDTLAGYGSDDESVSSSRDDNNAAASGASRLTGLLGNVSDVSDEEDNNDPEAKPVSYAHKSASKKQKLEPATHQSSSIIKNFGINPKLLEGRPKLELKDAPSTIEMQRNLDQLAKNLPTNLNGWSEHLKRQHDFHNPHVFASVVEHFQIQDPLGSVAVPNSGLKDYEKALFPDPAPQGNNPH